MIAVEEAMEAAPEAAEEAGVDVALVGEIGTFIGRIVAAYYVVCAIHRSPQ